MRTVRFAVLPDGQSVLNVPTKNVLLAIPSNKSQCVKSKKKGYYEAFRLLLANLVKADCLASTRPFTELVSVRRYLKYECHGREKCVVVVKKEYVDEKVTVILAFR